QIVFTVKGGSEKTFFMSENKYQELVNEKNNIKKTTPQSDVQEIPQPPLKKRKITVGGSVTSVSIFCQEPSHQPSTGEFILRQAHRRKTLDEQSRLAASPTIFFAQPIMPAI